MIFSPVYCMTFNVHANAGMELVIDFDSWSPETGAVNLLGNMILDYPLLGVLLPVPN